MNTLHNSFWIRCFFFLLLGSWIYPLHALDRTDFPIKVYVSPQIKNTEPNQPLKQLSPENYLALQQGVMDWNSLLRALPESKVSEVYTLILERSATIQTKYDQDFIRLTDRPEDADISVEGVDVFDLKYTEYDEETGTNVGVFKPRQGKRIGSIEISLRRENNKAASGLDLRSVVIHELGHALRLEHVPSERTGVTKCNIMAASVYYACPLAADPGCRATSNSRILCLGISDRHLRKVKAQIDAEVGEEIPLAYQEIREYSGRIDQRITTHIATLPFTQTGNVSVKVNRKGELQEVKIKESFGTDQADQDIVRIIKTLAPFDPLPDYYGPSEFNGKYFYDPNPALNIYLQGINEQLTQRITDAKINADQGVIQLTIGAKGALERYQISKDFNSKENNRKVIGILESFFPIKPLPGLANKYKVNTEFTYVAPAAPVAQTPVAKSAPQPKKDSTLPVEIQAYMEEMSRRIQSNWSPTMVNEEFEIAVFFTVARDGKISDIKIPTPVADQPSNEAAFNAVKNTKLDPLPKDFKYQTLRTRFTFRNLAAPQNLEPDFDLDPYITLLQQRISDNWQFPEGITANVEVKTGFTIQRDGTLTDIHIVQSSGVIKADNAALATLRQTRLDPLPTGYKPRTLPFTFIFSYEKQ